MITEEQFERLMGLIASIQSDINRIAEIIEKR
jgi:hypothetical protein